MIKRKKMGLVVLLIIVIAGSSIAFIINKKQINTEITKKWSLYWSDEFNGDNGSGVDSSKWVQEVGGDGWGNNEDQYYTEGTNNCYVQEGNLVIEAKKEDKNNNKYTSARIKTNGTFDFKYGKVEMRAKIPYGQGIWPAFWMLGSDIDKVNWPDCGEIDIMENI